MIKEKTVKISPSLHAKLKKFSKVTHRGLKSALEFLIMTNPHFEFLNDIKPTKVKAFNNLKPTNGAKQTIA